MSRLSARILLCALLAGGGTFGVILRSRRQVCDQDPAPGDRSASVELYIERDCWDW